MGIHRTTRLVAGAMVLVSLTLAVIVDPHWLWLTGFVGVNLLQSAFTDWCPLLALLRRSGPAPAHRGGDR